MKPIPVPKITDHSALLAELMPKRDAIGARLAELEGERLAAIIAFHETGVEPAPPPADPAALRVAELLGEAPPQVAPGARERLAELAQRIHDMKRALAVVDGRIQVERSKATAAVLAKVAPEYRQRIRAVAEAYKAAVAAQNNLKDLTDQLDAQELVWSSMGVVGPMPADSARRFLEDAARQGFVTVAEIPEELRS